jgi:hypothetical protein
MIKGSPNPFRPGPSSDLVAVLLAALWLLGWRAALDIPWGFKPVADSFGSMNVGIVHNPGDAWSYLSWAQQYRHGQNLAGLIYTTEPHSSLLWLFPLWLIGKLAAWTGWPILGVYNVAGLAGAMAAVYFLRRAASALRLPASARDWATVALVLGSGGTWLCQIACKLGWTSQAQGADRIFLDLFPSTAFVAYAYHATGLALLAGLWWSATEFENRLYARAPYRSWLYATAAFALLLGFSRPYEPVAFLGAWLGKTGWHWLGRHRDQGAWRSAAWVAFVLGFALLPGIGWSAWISRQPGWSSFANAALTLGISRWAWSWALAGWVVLVALGLGPAWRANARLAALPVAASVLGAVLLGLLPAHTKLASGLILGPIVLAGWGTARLVAATGRLPGLIRVSGAAIVVSALLGTWSLAQNLNDFLLRGPALIDAELVALAQKIPVDSGQPPIVLTDAETGIVLPGLIGAGVWAGHWSLSLDHSTKVAQLKQAGLDPHETAPENPAVVAAALEAVLARAHFDYALLDNRCRSTRAALIARNWQLLEANPRWSLLRAPHPSP